MPVTSSSDGKEGSGDNEMSVENQQIRMKSSGYTSDSINICKDLSLIIVHALRNFE